MLSRVKQFILEVFSEFSDDDCPTMAAALAYGTIFSLPSLLLIVIFIAGLVLGPDAASGQIQAQLTKTIGAQAGGQIQTMVHNIALNRRGGIIATILGVIGLLVSATSVVAQLQQSLNRAWDVTRTGGGITHVIMQRARSGLLVAGAGVLTLASLAVGAVIAGVARHIPFPGAAHAGDFITSIIVFTLIFGAILKIMPDVKLGWRDVLVGGLFIAVLFEIGKFLIGLYLGHAVKASAYGAAGSLAMILLWTYYSALVFLLGVEFTQVWVRWRRGRVEAKPGAKITRAAAVGSP
jgi:membrane protein